MPHGTLARTGLGVIALGILVLAPGCKEEEKPIPTLFDEEGPWAVVEYDLEGMGNISEVSTAREDAFLINFTKEMKVVQTAACVFPGDATDDPALTPGNSPCKMSPTATEWQCRCFGYAFEEDQMRWVEFSPGDTPPIVLVEDPAMGLDDGGPVGTAGGGSGDGTGSGGDDGGGSDGGAQTGDGTLLRVSEVPSVGFTYNFLPLPDDVFGSNGSSSRFVMQARGANAFGLALDDPQRPACDPCI